MDFSVIIPRLREAIEEYIVKKAAQGKPLTEREATLKWLDRYYDSWMEQQMGMASDAPARPQDRRNNPRLPIEISAYYRVLWTPQGEAMPDNAPAETAEVKNISSGGLYIVAGRLYPISTLMEIQFELPTIPDSISAFAMVVWREEHSLGRFGHGLHFSHIEVEHVDALHEAIMERLLNAPVVVLDRESHSPVH